ncbi:D-glycero-beta-D-manno-heptose 1-phosphate adenylyltransferase [Cytophagaceae bacterium YF14B1]|uniref:D-glycero-beta-D-manno-heptose 1-phosphate adenylyltransferase n=1 Tax=Xanthocytophaga flava TaxID=3048013 RepID=A0AAE3QLA6_9BACT|nr:D-glycero-beta-D-manno-heptose 1-phosphate adenylyltransferase [Xanthocytophaga flavus]MDJ1480741.1 D-glycero-beta-D-manno-heptose 1-phosphate adenylyltransferase [Xanthocytophaga flavus]
MTEEKIQSLDKALSTIAQWKTEGKAIAFTNGCFDIVHIGHVDYLEKARSLGDKLVLGLNTDASVRRLKGESRPIVSETGRSRVIAALEFVDLVVFFDEDTPKSLIEAIKPDILVKGDDYTVETIVGADFVINNGGTVKTIPLVKGFSTSSIVEKIRKSG